MTINKSLAEPWSFGDRCLASMIGAVVGLLSLLPKKTIGILGFFSAKIVFIFSVKNKSRILKNTKLTYFLPDNSHFSKMFVWQVIRHQVICLLETTKSIFYPQSVRVLGLSDLTSHINLAEASGFGHMIITGHVGSWEMVAYFGNLVSQKPFHVLAKPSRYPGVTLFLQRLRQRMGTPVLWNHKKSLVKEILGALKRHESIGFVMDQKPEGRKGPVVNFFDKPTAFVGGPAAIAVKTQCAVIGVFCLRENPFEYRLLSRTILPAGHQFKDEVELTQMMAAEIEGVIKAYPEQWLWNYKRW